VGKQIEETLRKTKQKTKKQETASSIPGKVRTIFNRQWNYFWNIQHKVYKGQTPLDLVMISTHHQKEELVSLFVSFGGVSSSSNH
jgi:hypothetical protein